MNSQLTADQTLTSIEVIDYKHLIFLDAFNEIYHQMKEFYERFGLEMNRSLIEEFISRFYPDMEDENKTLYLQLINPEKHETFLEV